MILDRKGFTLIEVVAVIVVLGILVFFTYSFFDHAVTSYTIGSRQTQLFQQATYTMERLAQELKDAKDVAYADGSMLWFYKANTSGQMDTNDLVWYYRGGDYLYRLTPWTARVIADKVSSFSVSRSASNCDANNPDCIITIDLELEDRTTAMGTVKVSINTKVAPKNFASGVGGRSYNGYYYDTVE